MKGMHFGGKFILNTNTVAFFYYFFFQNLQENNVIHVHYRVSENFKHNTFRPKILRISIELK